MDFDSYELTDFNLEGHIVLSEKFGLVKIARSDDGLLILVGDSKYGLIDQKQPTPANFVRTDSLLGFVLDIGIQRTKRLTFGHGYYFGSPLIKGQSARKISQSDFDKDLFEKIGTGITTYYQSGDKQKEAEAIRFQLLLDEYNNARLLFPNFYAQSYLSLLQVIDALANASGRFDFATFVAGISPALNQEIYGKLKTVYGDRIQKALALFQTCLVKAKSEKFQCQVNMDALDDAGKVIFSCFYSAYLYRSKFVHKGFPFPDIVKDTGIDLNSGLAYLNPALGISWSRFYRPEGLKPEDLIDIHVVVGAEAKEFKETYILLLPTWYFLKRLAREALLSKSRELV